MQNRLVKQIVVLFLILINVMGDCPKLTCQQIQDKVSCERVVGQACYWGDQICYDSYGHKDAITSSLACQNRLNEYDCNLYSSRGISCFWDGKITKYSGNYDYEQFQNEQRENVDGKCQPKTCSSQTDQRDCRRITPNVSCDWRYGRCDQIFQCSDAMTVHDCRMNYFKKRCVVFMDGQPDEYYKGDDLLSFATDWQCVPIQCNQKQPMFYVDGTCPKFVNGQQCITFGAKCGSCEDFIDSCSCTSTNACTWNKLNNTCRDVKCSDLRSLEFCTQRKDCLWNTLSVQCEVQNQDKACYLELIEQSQQQVNV